MSWTLPDPSIFYRTDLRSVNADEYLAKVASLLTEKLDSLGCRCECEEIIQAPQLARFVMVPAEGVSVRNLPRLAPELAYEIAVETVNILAPIPGQRAIGIEIPHPMRETVRLGDVFMDADQFAFPLGKDTSGKTVNCHLWALPHLLVGGQTGAGKSCFINAMLCSLLAQSTPDDLGLVLIDPKRVEMLPYEGLPHLLRPIVDDPYITDDVMLALVDVMEDRYDKLAREGVRNIDEHNEIDPAQHWIRIVVVVDELADLMMVNRREVEPAIARLAQKGRAAGIHLVLATQSPRVSVVTGIIKANLTARVGLTCATMVDSRVILDQNGCERLLGQGDMLYLPTGASTPMRVQGALVTLEEIDRLVEHWVAQATAVAA